MKEFKCKKCKMPLGLTDGKYLYVGGFALSFKTTGTCLYCEQVNCWRPLIGKNGIIEKPMVFDVLTFEKKDV